jgi:hypothetical protein
MTKLLLAIPALGLGLVLGGCAKDRHEAIPPSATLVSEAQGDIRYTAPEDGEVYVYDQSEDELIYSGRIRKGETLSLEPEDDEDKIRIESQVVSTEDLKEGNKHRVFFSPGRGSDLDRDLDRRDRRDRADLASDRDTVREERTTIIRDAEPAPEKKTVTETTETTTGDGDKIIVKEKKTTETP